MRNVIFCALTMMTLWMVPIAAIAGDGNLISWNSGVTSTQCKGPQVERLKFSPTLSHVPTYTGKGVATSEAIRYQGLPTGDSYNIKYLMRETPESVLIWYREALKQFGWVIEDKDGVKGALTAWHPDGLNCVVYTSASRRSGYGCEMTFRYSSRTAR